MHTDLAGEERERPWPGETTFHHADQVSEQPVVSGPHHHLLSSLYLHKTDPLVVLPTLQQEEGPPSKILPMVLCVSPQAHEVGQCATATQCSIVDNCRVRSHWHHACRSRRGSWDGLRWSTVGRSSQGRGTSPWYCRKCS